MCQHVLSEFFRALNSAVLVHVAIIIEVNVVLRQVELREVAMLTLGKSVELLHALAFVKEGA